MDFLNNITKDTLILCNEETKKEILNINRLLPIKILTISEFKKNYYYDYNENTILYLMNKYMINYDIAKMYIDNLYYIENNDYQSHKLDYLRTIKKELEFHNIRVSVDEREEKLGYKMRESVIKKIPYTLILGDKEKDTNTISYRMRLSDSTQNISINDFINKLEKEIKEKAIF